MKNNLFNRFVVLSVILGMTAAANAVSYAAGNPQRVIVTFEKTGSDAVRRGLESQGAKILKELPLVNGMAVLLPSKTAVSKARSLKGVKNIEEDALVRVLAPSGNKGGGKPSPSQPAQELPWGVDRIDAELAWSASKGTAVKVAVIDTGIDSDHADLSANIKGGYAATGCSGSPKVCKKSWDDDNGHGTHVAGTVAAADNSLGVAGVAPEAHLYAVKVLDRNGSGYVSDVIDGIYWAVNNGMQVVNMSLGTSSDIQALRDAVDAAYNSGVVIVAAAGNSGDGNPDTNEVSYPAKYSSVIAVAATASDNSTPSWSSEGAEVELAAPGVSIKSTWNNGGYNTISGTSMATPHVSGTVALLLRTSPGIYDLNADEAWNPAEIRMALRASADDLGTAGHDNHYGYGLVDAEESVTGNQSN
jgi:subtilisin